jgi:hypothetical protein
MSLDLDLQKDLHEAFRLLYDDEEDLDFDADWDEDEDDVQVPMNNTPPAEVEIPSTKYSKVPIAKPVISKLRPSADALPSCVTEKTTSHARRLDTLGPILSAHSKTS